MSAYKRIECSLKDRETLLQALSELGLEPEISETPLPLRGFQGDTRAQKAEIVVRKEQLNQKFTGASNDLGFSFNPHTKNYDMVISDYDATQKVKQRVLQAYATIGITKALQGQGFEVEATPMTEMQRKERHKVQVIGQKLI